MRMLSLLVIAPACLAAAGIAQTVTTIQNNGPVANRYDMVILGDGYTQAEEAKFDADALQSITHLFAKPAFGAYQSFFNVHTVFRASAESGADHPDANPPIFKNTAYDASYNTGGIPRCLYIGNTSLAAADSRLAPDVEGRVIVLVNDTRYGGCAGVFAVSYTGSSGPEVQAHEFGHSFGRLADEYDYGNSGTYSGSEPSQPNITADSTGQIKWPLWLGSQGVSTFEGAGYYKTGLWRPKSGCLMRSLGVALCPVCNEMIVKQAYSVVDPIENRSPAITSWTAVRGSTQAFSIANLVPGSGTIEWRIDDAPVATGTTSYAWDTTGLAAGRYTVSVVVQDLTPLVRKDPGNLLTSSTAWTVDLVSTRPGSYANYGTGCPGSLPVSETCLVANQGGQYLGFPMAVAGVTYAIQAIASTPSTVRGFELMTTSGPFGGVNVNVALYTADATGQPGTRVSTGVMPVAPALGWYSGSFASPYTMAAGQTFFVAFTVPTSLIGAPVVSGIKTPYYRDDGPGGVWNGPISSFAMAYKVTCTAPVGAVPSLVARGVPETGSTFDVVLGAASPGASAALLLGGSNAVWNGVQLPFDLAPLGAPGCRVLASGEAFVPIRVDGRGTASVRLAVPALPSLVNAQFYNQFYVLDGAANRLGLAWSNAGVGKVGMP